MSAEQQETQEDGTISNEQAEIFNRQACEMVSIFFQELASIPVNEIYSIASAEQGVENVVLLNTINRVFSRFIENGEGLPRVYFDSYARTVDSFIHTFKLNITNKLESNSEDVIKLAVGKATKDISYTDIAKVMSTPVEETTPAPTVE